MPVSIRRLMVFVVSNTSWSSSFIGIYKAIPETAPDKKIFTAGKKSWYLLKKPIFLSKKYKSSIAFKILATEADKPRDQTSKCKLRINRRERIVLTITQIAPITTGVLLSCMA